MVAELMPAPDEPAAAAIYGDARQLHADEAFLARRRLRCATYAAATDAGHERRQRAEPPRRFSARPNSRDRQLISQRQHADDYHYHFISHISRFRQICRYVTVPPLYAADTAI